MAVRARGERVKGMPAAVKEMDRFPALLVRISPAHSKTMYTVHCHCISSW